MGNPQPSYAKVAREDLATTVGRSLRTSLLDGTYEPGDRLPPERELAVMFGVDRNTVRSAIQELEQLGLVERRQGSGCHVLDYRETATLELLKYLVFKPGSNTIDVEIVQSAYVLAHATLAAVLDLVLARADEHDIAALAHAVDDLEAAVDAGLATEVVAAEQRVQRAAIRAAHTPAAELAMNQWQQLETTSFDSDGLLRLRWAQQLIDENDTSHYRRLIDALRRRDSEAFHALLGHIIGRGTAFVREIAAGGLGADLRRDRAASAPRDLRANRA